MNFDLQTFPRDFGAHRRILLHLEAAYACVKLPWCMLGNNLRGSRSDKCLKSGICKTEGKIFFPEQRNETNISAQSLVLDFTHYFYNKLYRYRSYSLTTKKRQS